MEMAERGDSSRVDDSLHDFVPEGDDEFYAALRQLPDIRYVGFGKITAGTASNDAILVSIDNIEIFLKGHNCITQMATFSLNIFLAFMAKDNR